MTNKGKYSYTFTKIWKLLPAAISMLTPGYIDDINVSRIREGSNVRNNATDVGELAISIRQKGLLQPILVRAVDGYYKIVAGNRRFSACKSLGWRKVSCHIIELDEKQAFEISLIENLQRKTLSPLDEAKAFKAYVSDFGWGGISELSLRVGKSVSYITKRIKLLNLPADVIGSILNDSLDISVAEELFSIKDSSKQSVLASLIVDRRLSFRKARELLKDAGKMDVDFDSYYKSDYVDHLKVAEKSFDKTIAALRIAMNNIADIINLIEHDWVLHEVLMQHKNMLNAQVDILIKEKKKLG
jgi:ParB family transcriptional regulator, chromosome partitioning protein